MNTFEQLNNYGSTTITYTDNRPYGVIFDKSIDSNLDRTITITDKEFDVAPSINIEEIVDATNAQVEYEIELPTSEATLAWDSLPSGVSLITVGNRYIIRYLSSVSDWEAVKDPTITIGDDFFGTFFYTIRIRYQTPTGQVVVRGIIGGELPLSDMVSRASMSTTAMHLKGLQSNMLGLFGVEVDMAVESYGLLAGPFGLTADLTYIIANGQSNPTGIFTTTLAPTRIFNMGELSYTTTATMNIIGDKLPAFDESVTRTSSEGDPEVVAADAGRLVYGHDMSDSTPGNVGEILWANTIAELDAIGSETITEIGGESTFSSINAIDISGNHLVLAGTNKVGFCWGGDIGDDYVNSSTSPRVYITSGFTSIRDVAATDDYFIVADYGYNSNQGRIHVYSPDEGGSPYSVTEEYTITLSGTNQLGFNVVANDTYIIASEGGYTSNDIHVFDVTDGSFIRTITGAIERPNTIDLWDKYLIVSSGFQNDDYDSGAYIYDVSTGNLHQTIASSGQIPSVTISEYFYATAVAIDDEIKIYNRQSNALWQTISDRTIGAHKDSIAIDNEYLITIDATTSPTSWYVVMYY